MYSSTEVKTSIYHKEVLKKQMENKMKYHRTERKNIKNLQKI